MEEVQALCPRIGIMDCGRVVACDTLPDLLRLEDASVRFRLARPSAELRRGLEALPDCRVIDDDATSAITTRPFGPAADGRAGGEPGRVRLVCRDVKGTLLRLGVLFRDTGTEPVDLEADEPNLESVFLHLTGRALRD
jgi:ABC-2 type transport system ATP-binding protein